MSRRSISLALLVLCSPLGMLAQGALVPAGGPAPSMKSLAQIEPRQPIGNPGETLTTGVTIDAAGSYVLMAPVVVATGNGITINAPDVTLDLNGFSITSTAPTATGTGITGTGAANARIFNGSIASGAKRVGNAIVTGIGFNSGISFSSDSPGILVSEVRVRGLNFYGMLLSGAATVRDCTATACYYYGISAAVIEGCVVREAGNVGLSGTTISNSAAASFSGIAISGTNVSNCWGSSAGDYGIFTTTAANCYGGSDRNGYAGIHVTGTASFCRAWGAPNAITGLHAFGCTAVGGVIATTHKDFCH